MDNVRIRQQIVRSLGFARSVLDVGCGDGSLVRFLAEGIADEALGIDIGGGDFHREINAARAGSLHRAGCIREDAHRMGSFPNDRFDAVVCVRAFHELSHPRQALREIRRVLRNGGLLFIADFAKGHEGERIWGERYYSPDEILKILRSSGFHEVSVTRATDEPFLFVEARNRKEASANRRSSATFPSGLSKPTSMA